MDSRKWSSHYLFIIASIGSTVGLSNIWKFTYLVGENGGGAFVLIYLASLFAIGVPVLTAELMIGRMGGYSMVGSFIKLSKENELNRNWQYFGWVAMLAVFLVLSFYCVIAGLTIDYTIASVMGKLYDINSIQAVDYYNDILSNPGRVILSQLAFVLVTAWIVARGVHGGLEKSVRWMMPSLFGILVVLLLYSVFTGEFVQTLQFLFVPDFSKITGKVALTAFGQAFFSLGVGVGVMLTYGAYMPKTSSIAGSAFSISLADGLVAIVSGLAIFPIVFKYGLSPAEGPGLLFMTLPIAFSKMPGGMVIGPLFFILLFFAALSSSISLLESIVSRLEEMAPGQRKKITWISGSLLWLVGLGTVFSFNIWANFTPLNFIKPLEGKTIFGIIDYFASNIIMPIGGILMAVIGGWMINQTRVKAELNMSRDLTFAIWRFLVRFVAPVIVLVLFLTSL